MPGVKKPPPRRPPRSSRRRRFSFPLAGFLAPLAKATAFFLFAFIGSVAFWTLQVPVMALFAVFRDGLTGLFGLGLPLVWIGIAVLVWKAWQGRLHQILERWRTTGGVVLAGLGVFGALSFIAVPVIIGGTSLAEVTAGGWLGQLVRGPSELWGLLRVLLFLIGGWVLVAPREAATTARDAAVLSGRVSAGAVEWGLERRGTLAEAWRRRQLARQSVTAVAPATNGREATVLVAPDPPPANGTALGGLPEVILPVDEDEDEEEEDEDEALALATGTDDSSAGPRPLATGERSWSTPPLDLLERAREMEYSPADNQKRARLIEETLTNYGVPVRVVQINQGPVVTQFGLEPGWEVRTRTLLERGPDGKVRTDRDGSPKTRTEEVSRRRVKVAKITALANDLALALAAPSIRIEAPVPGKPMLGVEVPNATTSLVTLRSVIESTAFQRTHARSKLGLALGKGVEGEAVVGDLSRMPHLLIAGATGSGKSVCINSIVCCLLAHATPEEVRFLMVDPKRVELTSFNDIPHLLAPVVVEHEKVVGALRWVTHEMDERYKRFAAAAARNIDGYNKRPPDGRPLPYIVVILDELADLMMASPFEVERTICRLAQLARATGIHLVIATQRPSVDVVTGLIKANFPTRIAFAVTSQVDSRTILDTGGAEKLLGRGDMLYLATDAAKPKRLQGVYVSDAEIERLVDYWRSDDWRTLRPPQFESDIERLADTGAEADDDPMLAAARAEAAKHRQISTSLLQRRLRIGYPRAARLMELLEEEGVIGPPEGSRSRTVLLEREHTGEELEDDDP